MALQHLESIIIEIREPELLTDSNHTNVIKLEMPIMQILKQSIVMLGVPNLYIYLSAVGVEEPNDLHLTVHSDKIIWQMQMFSQTIHVATEYLEITKFMLDIKKIVELPSVEDGITRICMKKSITNGDLPIMESNLSIMQLFNPDADSILREMLEYYFE
jgi:hypothetical protein